MKEKKQTVSMFFCACKCVCFGLNFDEKEGEMNISFCCFVVAV